MFDLLTQHQFWAAVAGYWIFSAAIGSMPEPGSNSGAGYLWVYRFLHTLAGNITTAFGGRIPGMKALVLVCLIPTLLAGAVARDSWLSYRAAISTKASADFYPARLAENLADLATAIRSFNLTFKKETK
jgi:hypothetical protein